MRGGSRTSASAPPFTSAAARDTSARTACVSSGAATRSATKPADTPCLNVCPTTATPASFLSAVGAEAAVVARRVEVAPAEVLRVAREVAPVAGRGTCAELVHLGAEPLDRAHLEAVRCVRGVESATRIPPRSPGRPSAYRTTPPARSGRAQRRSRGRSIHPSRRMKIGYDLALGKVTVSGEPEAAAAASFCLLQRREDALPAVARVGRDVHRDREPRLDALESRLEEAHCRDADRPLPRRLRATRSPPRQDCGRTTRRTPRRSAASSRRARAGRRATDATRARSGRPRRAHRVAVPRTLLNTRRPYVPGTVSLSRDEVARAREHELERPRRIRLDVVAPQPEAVA